MFSMQGCGGSAVIPLSIAPSVQFVWGVTRQCSAAGLELRQELGFSNPARHLQPGVLSSLIALFRLLFECPRTFGFKNTCHWKELWKRFYCTRVSQTAAVAICVLCPCCWVSKCVVQVSMSHRPHSFI